MATTPVEFKCDPGGTYTLFLYAYGSDTLANTGGDAATEATNNKGKFTASVTEALVGWYDARIVDAGGSTRGNWSVYLRDTTAIHRCEDPPAKMYDGAAEPQVDPIKWLGTALSTPTVAGVPNVNAKTWNNLTTVALPLAPTTAGRTLDVQDNGEASVDWTELNSIKEKTDNLPSDPADQSLIVAATDAIMSRLGAPAGASVSADIAAIEAQTDDIGASGAGLTAIAAVGAVTGAVGSVTARVTANADQIAGSGPAATKLAALYSGAVASGTVAAVVGNGDFTLTSTDLTTNNDDYDNMLLVFTSGNNKFIPRIVSNYTGATKRVEFTGTGFRGAFPRTVVAADTWLLLAGSP